MNIYVVLFVVAVAAVVYFVWSQRAKRPDSTAAAPPPQLPASTASALATTPSAAGLLASYDEYRRVHPSNMLYGKLTCNRCGSNLLRSAGGTASCMSCGAALYRG